MTLRLLATAVFALILLVLLGYDFVTSPSLPFGFYRHVPVTELRPGVIALTCLPEDLALWAHGRGYLPLGRSVFGACPAQVSPIGKRIVARSGDRLEFTADGLSIDGKLRANSEPFEIDSKDRPVPRRARYGELELPEGYLWFLNEHPRSLDSRLYGPLPESCVIAETLPVLVPGHPPNYPAILIAALALVFPALIFWPPSRDS